MTWYTLHCKVYNFIIICSLIWQRSQETLVLSVLDSDQINQQQVKLAESLHQYVVTGHSSMHCWSDNELGNKDLNLLGRSSLWRLSWANRSQSQPPWNLQLCTPPPPPPVVTRSQKPPAPETTAACLTAKRVSIRSAGHGMAWHGMVPAGGERVPDCGVLLALARPRRPLSTYATTERDLMTDNVVVNSVSAWQKISILNRFVLGFRSPADWGQSS